MLTCAHWRGGLQENNKVITFVLFRQPMERMGDDIFDTGRVCCEVCGAQERHVGTRIACDCSDLGFVGGYDDIV